MTLTFGRILNGIIRFRGEILSSQRDIQAYNNAVYGLHDHNDPPSLLLFDQSAMKRAYDRNALYGIVVDWLSF